MARGRFMSLWRRWSQLTAGLSTAARKSAMTSQPTKVRTCHIRKNAPSTTAVVSKAMATVRITCEVEALAHPTSWLGTEPFGTEALGSVRTAWGFVWVSPAWLISLAPTVSAGGAFSWGLSGVMSASPYGFVSDPLEQLQ